MTGNLTEEAGSGRVWLTADTHFGDADIIRYCGRPYRSAEDMDRDLVARWNARVGKNDVVWHLGDFGSGGKEDIAKVFRQLNGDKRIVLGNHDAEGVKFYYEIGFSKVYDMPVLFEGFFVLSHAPVGWVSSGLPFANVFGHVHNSELYRTFTARSACVCVERWGYGPAAWDDVLAGMRKEDAETGRQGAG